MSRVQEEIIISSSAGVFIKWDQILQKRDFLLHLIVQLATSEQHRAFSDICSSPPIGTSVR